MKYLLFPLAILYDLATTVRNRLYDLGYKPSASFDIPVIVVGNLSVGGTGKTPMVEYLVRLLHPGFRIATLSRGYKRKTKGYRVLGTQDNALTAGDEPFQLFRKFDGTFPVAVGEERALAISMLLHEFPDLDAIVLDDAFQHRRVKASFNILLTDYNRPFYDDLLLPAGRLRESRSGASRADVIVVTKCPDLLTDDERMSMENEIRKYADKPVFFSCIRYGIPLPISHSVPFSNKVVVLSGIANALSFEAYAQKHYQVIKQYNFPDHHNFSEGDIKTIADLAIREKAVVLTTEKDAGRLRSIVHQPALTLVPFFYLPIESEFLKNGEDFDEMVMNAVQVHHEPEGNS
jgi:tetraacyldisaccharide 4'-kinase